MFVPDKYLRMSTIDRAKQDPPSDFFHPAAGVASSAPSYFQKTNDLSLHDSRNRSVVDVNPC